MNDPRDPFPTQAGISNGWRWKPVDLLVMVIAFAVWWPLGFGVLAWKLWNDRQPVPQDLGQMLQTAANRLQQGVESLFSSFSGHGVAPPAMTGNAAFDAHIREELARMETERRKLDEEIAAFRAYLATERSGDRDLYERFRRDRATGRA